MEMLRKNWRLDSDILPRLPPFAYSLHEKRFQRLMEAYWTWFPYSEEALPMLKFGFTIRNYSLMENTWTSSSRKKSEVTILPVDLEESRVLNASLNKSQNQERFGVSL